MNKDLYNKYWCCHKHNVNNEPLNSIKYRVDQKPKLLPHHTHFFHQLSKSYQYLNRSSFLAHPVVILYKIPLKFSLLLFSDSCKSIFCQSS